MPSPLPPNIYSNNSVGGPETGSATIVVLDLLNTPLPDQQRAREQLIDFIKQRPEASQIVIKALATNSEQKIGSIENVELLGYGKVNFARDNEGLKVILPNKKPCDYAYTLRINGIDLV